MVSGEITDCKIKSVFPLLLATYTVYFTANVRIERKGLLAVQRPYKEMSTYLMGFEQVLPKERFAIASGAISSR